VISQKKHGYDGKKDRKILVKCLKQQTYCAWSKNNSSQPPQSLCKRGKKSINFILFF